MTTDLTPEKCPSDVFGARLRHLRKLKRLSVEALAAQCKEVGSPELTASVIYSIENGRRKGGVRTRHVTVEELLVLGRVFDVPPLTLVGAPDVQRARVGSHRGMGLVEDLTSAVQDAVDPQPTTDVAARIRTARRLMAQLALELDEVEDHLTRDAEVTQ